MGQCTISSLEEFRCDPYRTGAEVARSAKGKEPLPLFTTGIDFIRCLQQGLPSSVVYNRDCHHPLFTTRTAYFKSHHIQFTY